MAIDSNVAFVNTDGGAFPDNKAVNASGPTATDGTEFVKVMVDNYMFGRQQALLNYAGLSPNGSAEEDGNSQELDALKAGFGHAGEAVDWYGDLDPATLGLRILLLHGQGVLIANYPELVAATYVGDGNNAAADGFYKADDAAGTIRNTAGTYFILPDARGLFPRYLDPTGLVDVDGGGTRLPGEFQVDIIKEHRHMWRASVQPQGNNGQASFVNHGSVNPAVSNTVAHPLPDTFNTFSQDETRPKNITVKPGIRY